LPHYHLPAPQAGGEGRQEHICRTTIFLPLKRAVKGGKSTFAELEEALRAFSKHPNSLLFLKKLRLFRLHVHNADNTWHNFFVEKALKQGDAYVELRTLRTSTPEVDNTEAEADSLPEERYNQLLNLQDMFQGSSITRKAMLNTFRECGYNGDHAVEALQRLQTGDMAEDAHLYETQKPTVRRWFMHHHHINKPASITEPSDNYRLELEIVRRTISVALPLGADSDIAGDFNQRPPTLYCYLPTGLQTDFKFLVNADFILTASREEPVTGETAGGPAHWNTWMYSSIPDAVATAVRALVDHPCSDEVLTEREKRRAIVRVATLTSAFPVVVVVVVSLDDIHTTCLVEFNSLWQHARTPGALPQTSKALVERLCDLQCLRCTGVSGSFWAKPKDCFFASKCLKSLLPGLQEVTRGERARMREQRSDELERKET
jgi:hypothetical protein